MLSLTIPRHRATVCLAATALLAAPGGLSAQAAPGSVPADSVSLSIDEARSTLRNRYLPLASASFSTQRLAENQFTAIARRAGVAPAPVDGADPFTLVFAAGTTRTATAAASIRPLDGGVAESRLDASRRAVEAARLDEAQTRALLELAVVERYADVQLQRRLQLEAVEAQLAALSSELRPHFLFNAINNLAELVHHDPARTEAMLLHLSSLLQGTLAAGQHRTVSLADELTHIDDYLALQQMRFAERLTVRREIAAEVLNTQVPPMLLQPLVENAIEHGIEGRVGASMVEIRARAVDGALEMQVDDDGPGPYRSGHVGTGTGLRNVRARLAALYGEAAGVTLGERPGGGARLTVRLPLEAA